MVEHYTRPADIDRWLFCDNDSRNGQKLRDHEFGLPITRLLYTENIGDLPRYNKVMELVSTEFVVFISTDIRLFTSDWLKVFLAPFADPKVGIVGALGPGSTMGPAHADPGVGREWHWIPKLLVDRGIPFETCGHVQTHCFAVRTEAFNEVGGFWVPEKDFLIKGHLIAGEIAFSVKLRKAGWTMSHRHPPMYHYGNQAGSEAELDAFDASRAWSVDF